MIQVVVAEKNETMRMGMRVLFDKHGGRFHVSEVVDRNGLMSKILNANCQLIILDPMFCAGAGEALIRQIRRESPGSNVLVYTELDELKHGVRAIRSGARGYVMKSSPADELVAAADRICSGKMHMSEALAEEVALSAWSMRPDTPHEILSEREKLVFAMLVCGWKIRDIASALNLSAKTISTHKARAMAKMNCKSLSELIEYAFSHGLKGECESLCQVW
jgi:DNA-binding NarL/FixJ family response regulator